MKGTSKPGNNNDESDYYKIRCFNRQTSGVWEFQNQMDKDDFAV